MKKLFYTIAFALFTSFAISACTEESIQPSVDGSQNDPCQFGGPGCPKK
jgi:hypothetical protein